MSALGLVSLFGMHITMIVTEVVPFLVLALGVDNMFLLVRAFDRCGRPALGGRTADTSHCALRNHPESVQPRIG